MQDKTNEQDKLVWNKVVFLEWRNLQENVGFFLCDLYRHANFSWKEDGYRMQQDSCMRFIFQTDVLADRVANAAIEGLHTMKIFFFKFVSYWHWL